MVEIQREDTTTKENYPIGIRMQGHVRLKLESSEIVVWMILSDDEKMMEEVESYEDISW